MSVLGSRHAVGGTARIVALLVVLAFVAPFVVYAVPGVVGAEHGFVVLSGSMEPAISTGDAVLVERVDPATVEAGDVVTFTDGGATPVTHRVVEVREGEFGRQFVTQGDANEDPDPGVVTEGELVGRVMLTLPFVGYVVGFGGTAAGFVALVVVPLGLLLLTELRGLVSAARGSEDGNESERGAENRDGNEAERSANDTMEPTQTHGMDRTATTRGSSAGIAIAPGELRVGLAVLACFGPYSAWVAYATTAGWAVAAAVAANASLALVAALYLGGRGDGEPAPTAGATGGVDDAQ